MSYNEYDVSNMQEAHRAEVAALKEELEEANEHLRLLGEYPETKPSEPVTPRHELESQLEQAQAESAKLKAVVEEAADLFEAAADGHGVNFHQCAIDIRKTLKELE